MYWDKGIARFIWTAVLFAACTFSAGVKKDLATGLVYSYKGCSVREVTLVDAQQIPLTGNVVRLNETYAIAAAGVQRFQLTGGKAYPGCELTVKDTLGHTIAHAEDVLEDSAKEGIDTTGPLDLSATFHFSRPFNHGESYTVIARFFDKQHAENEIIASVKLLLE